MSDKGRTENGQAENNSAVNNTNTNNTPSNGNGKLREMAVDEFVRRLNDSYEGQEKKFVFFLGAGCSKSSGVPLAGELVKEYWLPRLKDLINPGNGNLDEWAITQFPGYDPDNPAASYGELINALFTTPHERQREIERLCEGKIPGFGYAVLAALVALDERFNIVLTTNFDDMVSDALYLYTEARPLVVHHDSLATYIRPTRTRPMVVKLHGDHRLSPRNTALETAALAEGIAEQTRRVMHDRGIVFLGYGGNDSSIHELLKSLPPAAIPYGAYWVNKTQPTGRMREWLISREGTWVKSGYFDEVMLLARNAFGLEHPDRKRFEKIFSNYHETFLELSKTIDKKKDDDETSKLKEAVVEMERSFADSWTAISAAYRLQKEKPDEAMLDHKKGIEEYTDSVCALVGFANSLTRIHKDYYVAEKLYKRALEIDPKNINTLRNYADFLNNIHKDDDGAEKLYKRALEIDPKDIDTLSNYADFLNNIRRNDDGAEKLYKRALVIDPNDTTALNNYANLLNHIRKDHDGAEKLYKRALEIDPENIFVLSNYANLLNNIHRDHDEAEELYKRVLEIDPKDTDTLGNYASLLLKAGRRNSGLDMLDSAFAEIELGEKLDLESECWFYLFAHGPEERRSEAMAKLKQLIVEKNSRSEYWDFTDNIERAISDDHPDGGWLKKLAAVINGKADPSTLDTWEAWANT